MYSEDMAYVSIYLLYNCLYFVRLYIAATMWGEFALHTGF